MDEFNLLPSRYRNRWKMRWAPIIITVTFLLCTISIGVMEWYLSRLRKRGTVVETSRRRRNDIADLKYLCTRSELLNKERELLEKSITNHKIWSNFLIELSESTPTGVQLKSLSMNARQGLCNIQGKAPNSQLVLEFKQRLEKLCYFDETAISTIARDPEVRTTGVAYEISGRFGKGVH